jgi:serine/threonine-protein kinase
MSVGSQVGAYRIIDQIGEGGMGSVWLAEHMTIGRRAAVKMLHGEYSGRQEIVQRFFNEARAATQISDPGIVQIFDFGTTPEGRAFIVMELLDGEALDRRLARVGKLPIHDALRIMRQVASTLGAAHARGIVHRDLKPENIFMVRDPEVASGERAKILDFGIAKLSDNAGVKTQTNAIMGTPQYMSPEQCRGSGKVDARSDVYALGCVMTALITGAPPFSAEGHGELIVMHMQQPAPPLSSRVPHVPPTVEAIAAKCLTKDVNERFASGTELAQALATLITSTSQAPAATPSLMPHQQATIALPAPTTLSGAVGQAGGTLPPPRSSKKGLVFGIVGVLAVAGGIAGVVVAKGGSSDAQPDKVAAAPPETKIAVTPPPPPPMPVTPPAPPPMPVEKPADPPPAPAKVSITIQSKPAGAQVFVGTDKEPRGNTPYVLEVDKGSPAVDIKLVAKGYQPKKAKVTSAESTTLALTLDKARAAVPTTTTSGGETAPSNDDDTMNPFAKKK